MKANYRIALALTAGVVIGGVVIQQLHAQANAPAYVVVDISAITDAESFKSIPAKASPASLAQFGGKYIIRSESAIAVDGPAPKRFVVIQFDSLDHAKAWRASENTKEIDAIRAKSTQSREFIVNGM